MHAVLSYADAVDPETSLVVWNEAEPEQGKGYQAHELGVASVIDADFLRHLDAVIGGNTVDDFTDITSAGDQSRSSKWPRRPQRRTGGEGDRQPPNPVMVGLPRNAAAAEVDLVVGDAVQTAFTITSNMTRASAAPTPMRPEPEATWRLGARSRTTSPARSTRASWLAANQLMSTRRCVNC